MRVKHKNSGEIIDLSAPNYGKHFNSIYGYLVLSCEKIYFFYTVDDEICKEDVTEEYRVLKW
jgi:hypothetical protein